MGLGPSPHLVSAHPCSESSHESHEGYEGHEGHEGYESCEKAQAEEEGREDCAALLHAAQQRWSARGHGALSPHHRGAARRRLSALRQQG